MLRKLVTIAIFTLAGTRAHAQATAWVQQTPGEEYPTIHVYSDSATQWDRVSTQGGLTFHVDARGQCIQYYRTQNNSFVSVYADGRPFAYANLGINEDHQNYGPDHGQGWQQLVFTGTYADPRSPNSDPVAMCNSLLASSAAGAADPARRRHELLAAGLTKEIQAAYTAEFALVCREKPGRVFRDEDVGEATTDLRAKLVCHGNPAALGNIPEPEPPPQRRPDPVGINSMDIWANPSASATYRGFCPKKIHFGGEIRYVLPANGNQANVRYRYVATQGENVFKSDVYKTTFTATGKKILKSWPLQFPLMTGGPQLSATTDSGVPDVYGGNVVLEFVGNPPIHANLQPVQFNVTCLKEGQFSEAVIGGDNTLGTPTRPRDPGFPGGNPQPDPWQGQQTTTANVNPNPTIPLPTPGKPPGSKDPAPGTPEPGVPEPAVPEPGVPEPGVPEPVVPSNGFPPGAVPAQRGPTLATPQAGSGTRPRTTSSLGRNESITIGGGKTESAAGGGKPDLVIRSVTRVPGNERALRVHVANVGTAPSPATQLTLFLPNRPPVHIELKPVQITSYQLGVLEAPIPLTGLTLRLQVDARGRIAEGNEANNTYVLTGVRHNAKETTGK